MIAAELIDAATKEEEENQERKEGKEGEEEERSVGKLNKPI